MLLNISSEWGVLLAWIYNALILFMIIYFKVFTTSKES